MYTKKSLLFFIVLSIFLIICVILLFLFLGKREVEILTNPSEVNYKIKNGQSGKTPAKIKLLPGNYTLEISEDGYKTMTSTFNISNFEGQKKLDYKLKSIGPKKADKPTTANERNAIRNEYYKKFPYVSQLPFQGKTFYITRPSNDGVFNVYFFPDNAVQAKQDTYDWFKGQGVTNPQILNIKWRYSTTK